MAEPVLQTRGLTKSFGSLQATKDVSIEIYSGEIHALIGPNGAGKSTLIAQLAGELQPDRGEIFLMGKEIGHLSVPQRAKLGLARTFQISTLAMEDTVLQNVLLASLATSGHRLGFWRSALQSDERLQALTVLERVGLGDVAHRRVAEISHGERRLLEVAIAVMLRPAVFIMDEPMAGLGGEGSADLTRLLSELRTVAPILLVEHDMDAVFALADRVSVLVYGQVIASGSVSEIRANLEVREAYLGDDV